LRSGATTETHQRCLGESGHDGLRLCLQTHYLDGTARVFSMALVQCEVARGGLRARLVLTASIRIYPSIYLYLFWNIPSSDRHSPFTFPVCSFRAGICPFASAISSFPFTTWYTQTSAAVLSAMSSAEDAKSLPIMSAEAATTLQISARSPYPLRRVQDGKERVRVESVVVVAPLDP